MQIILFGFPLTGKSTLFQLMTGTTPSAHAAPGEVHMGIARVPDPRIDPLVEMYKPKKITTATVEYLDIAGGIEKGQAAKNLPLDQLRNADALAHVVRAFADETVPHGGPIDPASDVATMETELILADHTIAERRVEKLELAQRKAPRDEQRRELEVVQRCLAHLDEERPLRELELDPQERALLHGFTFLSLKPLLIMVNAGEDDTARLELGAAGFGLEEAAGKPATQVVALSAKIEAEIARLEPDDAVAFRAELGIHEPALDRAIHASYHLLGRQTFFTVGEDEVRAWTIRLETTARRAAGTIHSDIERGFIRAELVHYDDLMAAGTWSACRDRGTLRLEGKDYVMHDGDVVNFRFNV